MKTRTFRGIHNYVSRRQQLITSKIALATTMEVFKDIARAKSQRAKETK